MARIKRKTSGRVLYMKFRIIPRVRMTRSHMFRLLDDFVATGTVPDDIDIESADYGHGKGKRWSGGVHYQDIADITDMIHAFKSANRVRFERAD